MEEKKSEPSGLPVRLDHTTTAIVPKLQKESSNDGRGQEADAKTLRIIPVKNTVLFPHNVMPLTAGKEFTNETLEWATRGQARLGVVAQRDGDAGEPQGPDDLYEVGCEAKVLKIIKFPDNTYGAVLQGFRRFRVSQFVESKGPNIVAEVEFFEEEVTNEKLEVAALGKSLKQLVQKAISLSPNIPNEAAIFIENVQDPSYLADLVMPYLSIDFATKQTLLETKNLEERLRKVHFHLTRELEILEMSQKIHSEVRSEVGKAQRKYYVKEQLKLLQKELTELDGGKSTGTAGDKEDLSERIAKSNMPKEAKEAASREVERMGMMQPGAPEYMVSFTYVNWLLDVPWDVTTQTEVNLKNARNVLDEDHFGLEKIKKRILEFLAVYALRSSLKGPILLLVGPPGVGKTSLGKSIARSLGRTFVRIALGGVRDEAEIRGHRRTYIGSMPGKFVDALKKAGSSDPVILLDEVDKLSADHRGDPASALLEVLDSEQNHAFMDHYLNVPVDLSKVFFIATANSLDTIPPALRDRMEVLELSGYTIEEKSHIAFDYLIPQVLGEHGLSETADIKFKPEAVEQLIQGYTREAGVRQLRREVASIARGVAHEFVVEGKLSVTSASETKKSTKARTPKKSKPRKLIDKITVEKYLGPAPFSDTKKLATLPVGVATGLAYTPVGGDVLFIETATSVPGEGRLSLTGQLGDVMKESVQTALAYIKANPNDLGIKPEPTHKVDLHVHFPAGAIRKDGPSAGVAVFVAMVSQFTGRKVSADVAMTGEISLRGDVLPVGGIKEKLIAAHRYGIRHALIPKENEKDLIDLPKALLREMKVTAVSKMSDVLDFAFSRQHLQSAKGPSKGRNR